MSKTLTYADVQEAFEPDGSWRDLYAFETTEVEWRKFLKAALESDWPTDLRVNDQATDQIEEVLAIDGDDENSASLSIDVSGATLMCYLFDDEEMKLDMVPEEINDANFKSLLEFIAMMADATSRNVFVTEDGMPQYGIFAHEVETSATMLISRPPEPTELSRRIAQSLHPFASRLRKRRRPLQHSKDNLASDAITQRLFELSDDDAAATIEEWNLNRVHKPNRIEYHTQLTEREFRTLSELDMNIRSLAWTCDSGQQTEINESGASSSRIEFWSRLELACRAFGIPTRED